MSYISLLTLTPVLLESESILDNTFLKCSNHNNADHCCASKFLKVEEEAASLDGVCYSEHNNATIDNEFNFDFLPHTVKIKTPRPRPFQLIPLSNIPLHLDKNFLDYPFFTDQKSYNYLNSHDSKVMFIMRGLPGSGKSTVVNVIKQTFKNSVICSADDYFYNASGRYCFDEKLLSAAHSDCQQRAKRACSSKVPIVVIDNTNVRSWEMKFYTSLANCSGYVAVTVLPRTPWRWKVEELAARNKHGLSAEVLHRKVSKFDQGIPLYYGWFLSEAKSKCLTKLSSRIFAQCLSKFPELKRALLRELSIRPEHVDEETALGILSEYHSNDSQMNPLLHCTSKFCGRGKASGANEYHQRADVQQSCGRVFNLTITGLIITTKTMGARISLLDPSASSLYDHLEETEWDPECLDKRKSSASAKKRNPTNKRVRSKKNKHKYDSPDSDRWNWADPGSYGKVNNSSHSMKLPPPTTQSVAGDKDIAEHPKGPLDSSPLSTKLSELFPSLINAGHTRSAHITLKKARGVESREVNFDVLQACDMEAAHSLEKTEFVPVSRGQACYYGNGLCCVYFDKPLSVKSLFSGCY